MPAKDYAQIANEMRAWLNSQPHLPKDVSDSMLCRFAHSCYFDLERAKSAADTFFSLRRGYPQFFTDRDPNSPHMKNIFQSVKIARYEVSGNRQLFLYQMIDHRTFDIVSDAKLNFLVDDCWFLENEKKFDRNDVYFVADVKDLSVGYFWKLSMTVLKTYAKYQREATPVRLKEIHVVNTSFLLNKLFKVVKPLLSEDIKSIHFHEPNSTTLYNFFSKDELPADYGGTGPTMDTLMTDTIKLIEDKRDTVLSKGFWVASNK